MGLKFRSTTRAIEAERIDSFVGGAAELDALIIENEDFAEILVRIYEDPDSLTDSDIVRFQHWMIMHYDNFRCTLLDYQSGLLPEAIYAQQRAGVGYIFSSDIGFKLIKIFRDSDLNDNTWTLIEESAKEARSYCLDPENVCLDRIEKLQSKSAKVDSF